MDEFFNDAEGLTKLSAALEILRTASKASARGEIDDAVDASRAGDNEHAAGGGADVARERRRIDDSDTRQSRALRVANAELEEVLHASLVRGGGGDTSDGLSARADVAAASGGSEAEKLAAAASTALRHFEASEVAAAALHQLEAKDEALSEALKEDEADSKTSK